MQRRLINEFRAQARELEPVLKSRGQMCAARAPRPPAAAGRAAGARPCTHPPRLPPRGRCARAGAGAVRPRLAGHAGWDTDFARRYACLCRVGETILEVFTSSTGTDVTYAEVVAGSLPDTGGWRRMAGAPLVCRSAGLHVRACRAHPLLLRRLPTRCPLRWWRSRRGLLHKCACLGPRPACLPCACPVCSQWQAAARPHHGHRPAHHPIHRPLRRQATAAAAAPSCCASRAAGFRRRRCLELALSCCGCCFSPGAEGIKVPINEKAAEIKTTVVHSFAVTGAACLLAGFLLGRYLPGGGGGGGGFGGGSGAGSSKGGGRR